jgi:hypothetical protein
MPSGLGGASDKASPSFSPELSNISVCGPPGTERTRRDGLNESDVPIKLRSAAYIQKKRDGLVSSVSWSAPSFAADIFPNCAYPEGELLVRIPYKDLQLKPR